MSARETLLDALFPPLQSVSSEKRKFHFSTACTSAGLGVQSILQQK